MGYRYGNYGLQEGTDQLAGAPHIFGLYFAPNEIYVICSHQIMHRSRNCKNTDLGYRSQNKESHWVQINSQVRRKRILISSTEHRSQK